jgi:hypothetical protein
MNDKTITLSRELLDAAAVAVGEWGDSLCSRCNPGHGTAMLDLERELRDILNADPVPPVGGEPEVFEPHGWAQTDGPAINAFTQEFDIAEEWSMSGYGTVELLNREHVDAEIDRLRGEHQAIATRLQAEVEQWRASNKANALAAGELVKQKSEALDVAKGMLQARVKRCADLQSELTKARELLAKYPGQTNSIYEKAWVRERNTFLSNQSAPADKGQREPVVMSLPSEDELIASGLGYPFSKEEAVQLYYSGFKTEPITVLEAWDAIGHDIGCNPSKDELLDSLRNMAAICDAHGNDMPAEQPAPVAVVLAEAREWLGDGKNADGLTREHWTPEYAALIDRIDATLSK